MVYEIDGLRFHTLDEFFNEVSAVLIPGSDWGRNLDAFNDILRGGFGTPEGGFTIQWRNHAVFDLVVEIIRNHGPGGDEAQDGVQLILD